MPAILYCLIFTSIKTRANGNPNPSTDLDEILHAHFHLSKEGFGAGLTTSPHPGPGGPKTLKAEGHIFEKCLQNKRFLVGCKLTRAMPGTSARLKINQPVPYELFLGY